VSHSLIVGNKLNGVANDLFTGSVIDFVSNGYNRIGVLDFSQILVPIPEWLCLNRKHWPKVGDRDGIAAFEVLSLEDIQYHGSIKSAGTDAGQCAVLWYPPSSGAVDQIPLDEYFVDVAYAGYSGYGDGTDDFLNQVLEKLRTDYGGILGSDFGSSFGDLTGVTWYYAASSWPSDPQNAPWITFWRNLDAALGDSLGTVKLGDEFWGSFEEGPLGANLTLWVSRWENGPFRLLDSDQFGNVRPCGPMGDIGAIEMPPPQ
jgi:hypothetical protein